MTPSCEHIFQTHNFQLMDLVTLLISVISFIVACYAFQVSKVAAENQVINSILTNLTQQTNSMENFTNNLLSNAAIKGGVLVINVNHWSYILTPIIKSKQLFEMYETEYKEVLSSKQFRLILKTFYIQIPQLIKMRIYNDNLIEELSLTSNMEYRETLLQQLKDSKIFLTLASSN